MASRGVQPQKLINQIDLVLQVLIDAHDGAAWLTVGELAAVVGAKEPSVSAQIRNLRKQENGAWTIAKRVREHGIGHEVLWEYKILMDAPVPPVLPPAIDGFFIHTDGQIERICKYEKISTQAIEIVRTDGRIERICEHGIGHTVGHLDKTQL